ncbi:UvrD-helicase domain-containing protein [Aurantibacillus circumpalustris]|uniref:UvrD-helicase domain-containing protein n=1 Tax=Aurantibacillus circumpalustris TaxID=3036359 RepID=UPI00295B8673|nr:UvrD-helicase domain-containing protein [Aurantibacillus circumpalustris]
MKFTQEQEEIIHSTGDIKINAVAGSGKTTTIIEYARLRPTNSKILYLVFNRSVKKEAEKKFREKNIFNVKVETAHSLAYKHIIVGSNYKVRPTSYKTYEVSEILRLNGGGEKHAEYMVANHINKFISYFCNSDKQKLSDLNYLDSISDYKARDFVKRYYNYIEKQTANLLEKMEMGQIDITHDFYLKKFHLLAPQLKYDFILFDEGQDASAAILDVFLKQSAVKVIVGDTHQQIYAWRHAVNSLEKVNFKTFNLSSSFRFGQDIADLANRVLIWKNHIEQQTILPLKGEGLACEIESKAVIARTNLGLLLEAINFVIEKRKITRIYFEGNFNSYTYAEDGASLYDVLNLFNGKHRLIRDKLIKTMRTMEDLEEYIDKTEDSQLGIMVEIVKEYGNAIPVLIKEIKSKHVGDSEKDKAEIVFSTVHRCKGMEYDAIQLANDFITENKILELKKKVREEQAKIKLMEEVNLLYVALTRTKNSIHIHSTTLPEGFRKSPVIHCIKPDTKTDEMIDSLKSEMPAEDIQSPVNEKSYSVEKIREKYKVAYMPWTPEMDQELVAMISSDRSVKQIVELLERSKGAIYSRIKKLELEKKEIQ